MLGKRSTREEDEEGTETKDFDTTDKRQKQEANVTALLRRIAAIAPQNNILEQQIPVLYAALTRDPSAVTERLMQDNYHARQNFLRVLERALEEALVSNPQELFANVVGDPTTVATTTLKRLIAKALMHDWVPIEIMGCRLGFLGLFLSEAEEEQEEQETTAAEFIAWFKNELATNEELWLEDHTHVEYGGKGVPQWAFRMNRLDIVQFCWQARMGPNNRGDRFFGREDHWFGWDDDAKAPSLIAGAALPLATWWAANVTRANFRRCN